MQDDTFVFSELVVITSLGCISRQECRFCRWTGRHATLAHADSFHLPAVSGSCCLLLKTSAKRDENRRGSSTMDALHQNPALNLHILTFSPLKHPSRSIDTQCLLFFSSSCINYKNPLVVILTNRDVRGHVPSR